MMDIDKKYMRRALRLAANGILDASPNPMVGAVIVAPDGTVIGEGWHRRCGEGHAEVNAIASVRDESLLRDCTMYVTLEPCSHYGKTPPCSELIIRKGIPRVVVGSLDPFEKVSGRGVGMLEKAGVEVSVGCLEKECLDLNEKFMTAHRLHRPFITLKWAESADGFIDGRISTPLSSMYVHRLRACHDAIMVGSVTWLADSPRLDTRLYGGRSPRRIVMDRRGRIGDIPDGVSVINDSLPLADVMRQLYDSGVTSLLVEGGAELIGSFLHEGLWDRLRVERGSQSIHGSVKSPAIPEGCLPDSVMKIDNNEIYEYKNHSGKTC